MAGRYRLVASDLDGTLLTRPGQHELDQPTIEAIRALAQRGVRFVAASGRQYANLRRLFSPVGDETTYLCENGALVVWRGDVLVKRPMPRDLALEACHAILERPGCDLLVSGERMCYVMEGADEFAHHMRFVVGNDVAVVARPEDVPEDIIKIAYRVAPEAQTREAAHLSDLLGDRCEVMTSGSIWTDVMPRGVGKGPALLELGRIWGMAPEEMVAFGDNENDASMLDAVGLPYLMESGNPKLRTLNARIRTCRSVPKALEALLATPGAL